MARTDVSLLAGQYKSEATFAHTVNEDVIVMLRARLGIGTIEATTLAASRHNLVSIMQAVRNVLAVREVRRSPRETVTSVSLPFVERLSADPVKLDSELKSLASRLEHEPFDVRLVSDEDVRLLERLANAADGETSAVFRRLIRQEA